MRNSTYSYAKSWLLHHFTFKDFREEFNKYKKQDSDFQETSVNNFTMSLLDRLFYYLY